MNQTEFLEHYTKIVERALYCLKKTWSKGLLALEDELDFEKADERDIFEYGLRFAIDGVDPDLIEEILSNIIAQENDEQMKTLKIIQKEAVLKIWSGVNPYLLYAVMNSYTGISLDKNKVKELLEE